jgi:hypothetical protein
LNNSRSTATQQKLNSNELKLTANKEISKLESQIAEAKAAGKDTKSMEADLNEAKTRLNEADQGFKTAGIKIPIPQREVRYRTSAQDCSDQSENL